MKTQNQSNKPMDGISILIPCAGRLSLLEKLLRSVQLARNNFPLLTEILLVDNSKVEEQEIVRGLAKKFDASYYLQSNNISQKRNFGVENANYSVVLFLDSDCFVDVNILSEHYNAYSDPCIAGCLGLLTFVGQDTHTWKSVEQTGVLECFTVPLHQKSTLWGPTANISFRRESFLQVGGFDPQFSKPGGEDVDIGFRIADAGWRLSCNPKAVAYHTKETWSSFWQVYERFIRYGSADALLLKKHKAHSIIDFPMNAQYMLLVTFFAGLWTINRGFSSLLIPVVWAGLSAFIYSGLKWLGQGSREAPWFLGLEELLLLTSLDIGRIVGALKYKEGSAFFKRIIFFEGQLDVDWTGVSLSSFACASALIITLTLFSIFWNY